jgi:5'-3' exonuclease
VGGKAGDGKEKFKKAGLTDRVIKLLEEGKEEAEFSKMLATIRRDAPIKFALPEVPFKESFDIKKVNELFTELDFRTLGVRLLNAVSGESAKKSQESS